MQVVRKEISPVLSEIEITIEPQDYASKFEDSLKKYKNKAQVKGFRKGMIPLNTLKKMYGKSLLVDTVYEVLNESFNQYLTENKINTLGSPVPSEGKEAELDFDIFDYKSFTFHFDVGIIPEFEIAGVSENDVYDIDDVIVDEKTLEDNILDFRKRSGKQTEVGGPIEEKDALIIHAEEVSEDLTIKQNGWKTEFTILVESIKDEDLKTSLIGKDNGFVFHFDMNKLENQNQVYIDKYYLNRTEADKDVVIGNLFQGKVHSIKRVVPAELTEAFFEELADEKIKNEADLREIIQNEIKDSFSKSAKNLLERKIFDKIKEETKIEFSKDFFRRLLSINEKNNPEDITDENLDKAMESTRWMIIKDHLLDKHTISVNESEIKNHFFNQVMGYFRYYPNMDYNIVFDFVEKQMKNKNAVEKATDEIKVSKLFAVLTDVVSKNPVPISSTDFLKKVENLNSPE